MKDQDAVKIYSEMLEEKPDDVSARFSLACALFRMGHHEGAREQFEKILGQYAESLEARLSRDWLDRLYKLRTPEQKNIDVSELKIQPLSVCDIVSKKTTHLTRENYCFFHSDREKKFSCSVCGKPLCAQCSSLRKAKVMCPECIAKGAAETKQKSETKTPPLMRGVYSGLIVSVFLSFFSAALHRFGVGMVFLGFESPTVSLSASFLRFYLVHLSHFSLLCALAGAMSQHYEKLTFLKCAEFSSRFGIGWGVLFSIASGAETMPEFAVPLFQFWFSLFIAGLFISFVNSAWFIPMDEVRVRA